MAVGDVMDDKGWHLDRQNGPDALHMMVSPEHHRIVDAFLADLHDAVANAGDLARCRSPIQLTSAAVPRRRPVRIRRWPVVVALLAVVVVVWGVAFSGIKVLLRDIGPYSLTWARLVLASLAYTVVLPFLPKRDDRNGEPGDVTRLVAARHLRCGRLPPRGELG